MEISHVDLGIEIRCERSLRTSGTLSDYRERETTNPFVNVMDPNESGYYNEKSRILDYIYIDMEWIRKEPLNLLCDESMEEFGRQLALVLSATEGFRDRSLRCMVRSKNRGAWLVYTLPTERTFGLTAFFVDIESLAELTLVDNVYQWFQENGIKHYHENSFIRVPFVIGDQRTNISSGEDYKLTPLSIPILKEWEGTQIPPKDIPIQEAFQIFFSNSDTLINMVCHSTGCCEKPAVQCSICKRVFCSESCLNGISGHRYDCSTLTP